MVDTGEESNVGLERLYGGGGSGEAVRESPLEIKLVAAGGAIDEPVATGPCEFSPLTTTSGGGSDGSEAVLMAVGRTSSGEDGRSSKSTDARRLRVQTTVTTKLKIK